MAAEPEPVLGDTEQDPPPVGTEVWEDLDTLRALIHPLRMRAYVEAVKGPVSAKELAESLGVPLQRMSYHVRLLAEAGLLHVVRRTPRRGAVETHYRAVATLEVNDDALMASPELLQVWTQMMLRLVTEDAEHAVEQGAGADTDFLLARAHFAVDAAGHDRVHREILDFYDRMARLEEELRAEDGEATHSVNLGMIVHPGRRESGRNGPIISQMGTTRPTIPPD
jgi:DNA-binding transcriptional ArsR family regulator